ncbi:MAG: hypothetical protein GXX78_08080 [Bacteroidales bacterium]|nr:hypothetical protein [Bacteroidales bacterium]
MNGCELEYFHSLPGEDIHNPVWVFAKNLLIFFLRQGKPFNSSQTIVSCATLNKEDAVRHSIRIAIRMIGNNLVWMVTERQPFPT